MAKYKAKRDRRWKYAVLTNHEFLDGAIVQYDFAKKNYKNNIGKVFLADVKSSKYDDWFHSNTFYSEDYFTNVEDLVLVDGNYVRQSKARTIARTVTTSSGQTETIGGANAGFFQMDMPDIQGLIRTLDLLDENINKAVRKALHKGADIILAEQRRLAPHNLSHYISKGNIYTTKNGTLGIAIGYMSDTFKEDANGFNAGVVGMTYEFGRPR